MSLGDFDVSTVLYGKFTTIQPSTGANFTLAGTPALSVYKDASLTQSTTGVSLTADFDSVTGLNHFAIDTSTDGTFYSAGSFFSVVITTGTVNAVSAVGNVVGVFTLRKTASLKPTAAGRSLDVSATGEAGVDWANVGSPTTTLALTGTTVGTSTALGAQAKVDVGAAVVSALTVDTYPEPGQGAPGATISIASKIGYLYKAFRNKVTQSPSVFSLYADDGVTVDQKTTTGDTGSIFTRDEIGSGP